MFGDSPSALTGGGRGKAQSHLHLFQFIPNRESKAKVLIRIPLPFRPPWREKGREIQSWSVS